LGKVGQVRPGGMVPNTPSGEAHATLNSVPRLSRLLPDSQPR
jgi:hypothetical protein